MSDHKRYYQSQNQNKQIQENHTMQLSQKTFGSQNAIKQLYRQYSTTFKNTELDKNKTMTQSSNLHLDKIYNAFNSTGHIKNFTLDRFKHSEAKSIIEKLMQTKELTNNPNKEDDFGLLNELQNLQGIDSKGPIPLSQTEQKIFCEVVNLISEIAEIKKKTEQQNEEFVKLKLELKNQGIQFPEVEQKKSELDSKSFKRFTSEELQKILEQNQNLQREIQKITKQVTNKNQQQNQSAILQSLTKENFFLKKQLSNVKSQIINSGEVDDQEMFQLSHKIEQLKKSIFILEQKRLGKLTDKDEELRSIKAENERLRLRTIEILKTFNQPSNQRRLQLIGMLRLEQQQKEHYADEMSLLKSKYEILLSQNARLRQEGEQISNYGARNYYDGPQQIQSKVSPFQNIYGEYHSIYGIDKQNYFQNYEPQRVRNNQYGASGKYVPNYSNNAFGHNMSVQRSDDYYKNEIYY